MTGINSSNMQALIQNLRSEFKNHFKKHHENDNFWFCLEESERIKYLNKIKPLNSINKNKEELRFGEELGEKIKEEYVENENKNEIKKNVETASKNPKLAKKSANNLFFSKTNDNQKKVKLNSGSEMLTKKRR